MASMSMALAAMILVLSRVIPQGHPAGTLQPERSFVGGDILIFTAQAPLDVASSDGLIWRWWTGSDWQSHALYFFPHLENSGYLTPEGHPGWRALLSGELVERVKSLPNVEAVEVYRSFPCIVHVDGQEIPAFLRGRVPGEEGYPLDAILAGGRALNAQDKEGFEALVPAQGPLKTTIEAGNTFRLECPALRVRPLADSYGSTGYDVDVFWDLPSFVQLTAVGSYQVPVGEEDVDVQSGSEGGAHRVTSTVFWQRPEIIVDDVTFADILGSSLAAADSEFTELPAYQIAVKVSQMSLVKRTVAQIRDVLGAGFAVYSMPDLVALRARSSDLALVSRDFRDVLVVLTFGLSATIVSGTVYILLTQQRRKIGLLRVIGATRKNVLSYALWIVGYVVLTGSAIGFGAGKLMSLLALISSDATFSQWLAQAFRDFLDTFGLAVSLAALFGTITGVWASRIPCAEVLKRE